MSKLPVISIDVTLFWQIINFLILMIIFKKYFRKPLSKMIKERKKIIEENIESAKRSNEEATKKNIEMEKALDNARTDAIHIMQKAKTRANIEQDNIINNARDRGRKIIKKAEEEAHKIKEEANNSVIEQARILSIELAEKLLSEKIDKNIETDLINEFITKVGEE